MNVRRQQSDGCSVAAVLKRCTLCTLTAGETRLFMQSILFLHSFKEVGGGKNSLFSAAFGSGVTHTMTVAIRQANDDFSVISLSS